MSHQSPGRKPGLPSYAYPKPDPIILNRDFDQIDLAEGEYRDLILRGSKLEVDIPRTS